MDKARRPTLEDVAREANVSRAAVSKVIRNAHGVSAAMREKVLEAVERTDYRPDAAARAMVGSSYVLGLELAVLENPAIARIAQSASDALRGTGYQLVAAPANGSDATTALEALLDLRVAGIVAIAPLLSQETIAGIAARTPTVMLARHDDAPEYDTVRGDDQLGTSMVMDHLFGLGHRRIAHLTRLEDFTSPRAATPHSRRLRTYLERMRERGLAAEVRVVQVSPTEAETVRAVRDLLVGTDRPTAIFCATDDQALSALRALMELGLSTRDVSIAGYDDLAIAAHPAISLTTVAQSVDRQGVIAIELLLERLKGRTAARHVTTRPVLRPRTSTGPAREGRGTGA